MKNSQGLAGYSCFRHESETHESFKADLHTTKIHCHDDYAHSCEDINTGNIPAISDFGYIIRNWFLETGKIVRTWPSSR